MAPKLERIYQVWVCYQGSPTRRIAERLTLKEAQDRVTLEGKLAAETRSYSIYCSRTGRFISF